MTPQESRNLAVAERYIDLYNHDIERFVPECYTPDVRVYAMGAGIIDGPSDFLNVERTVLRAAPERKMRLDQVHLTEDSATLEITVLDPAAGPDWQLPFVAVLNIRDGLIAVDRSYADWARWPGLGELIAAGGRTPVPPPVVPQVRGATDPQRRHNLTVAQRYGELYNTDPERFVRECYHEDYRVGAMGLGWYDGIDKFIAVEKAVVRAAPKRRMRIDFMHATASAVVVEAQVVDAARGVDWGLPFCAVLDIRGDKIAVDRTYAEFNYWPGLDGVI